jgi:hypothetical protein
MFAIAVTIVSSLMGQRNQRKSSDIASEDFLADLQLVRTPTEMRLFVLDGRTALSAALVRYSPGA